MVKRTLFAAAAVVLCSAAGAQAEYRVSAFKSAPGYEALMEGDYQSASEEAGLRFQSTGFATDANRCVGLLMVESLPEALKSCNRALRQLPDLSPLTFEARRANESVVLSNRGVVLAMQGNLTAAEEDFARALKLDDDNANAQTNLNHLRALKVSAR
ncbi:MAG: tetratricopeptide repeat protein [Pseudomonadales bacterium]